MLRRRPSFLCTDACLPALVLMAFHHHCLYQISLCARVSYNTLIPFLEGRNSCCRSVSLIFSVQISSMATQANALLWRNSCTRRSNSNWAWSRSCRWGSAAAENQHLVGFKALCLELTAVLTLRTGDQQPAARVGAGEASDAGGAGAAVPTTGSHAGARRAPWATYVSD